MWNSYKAPLSLAVLACALVLATACTSKTPVDSAAPPASQSETPSSNTDSGQKQADSNTKTTDSPPQQPASGGGTVNLGATNTSKPSANSGGTADPGKKSGDSAAKPGDTTRKPASEGADKPKDGSVQVIAKPADIAVIVNKSNKLPDNYKPDDLVDPDVPFTFKEKIEKRKMRKEAAAALEKLFKAAKDDKLPLAGVSAFRSNATQTTLYNSYVKQHGEQEANKFSAKPGQSEHETGLAIDVAGANGKCPAQDCFGATKEAKWLAEHAHEYGFIIRYLKGKEDITGYQYEPWHLRYVGVDLAKDIVKQGVTLEEYFSKGVPVSKPKS
ncbi:D-alanyl-D-alanine carboxypeptidase family protein [Paenibacillus filicis]|uniref:D-alanyl-D-alanine carboxypeptidase family protein n=1 Tax=Paenibacillus filicis TaxID=669464 RepID=A0ABU9DXP1_9BACL